MAICANFAPEPCPFPLSCSANGCSRQAELARLGAPEPRFDPRSPLGPPRFNPMPPLSGAAQRIIREQHDRDISDIAERVTGGPPWPRGARTPPRSVPVTQPEEESMPDQKVLVVFDEEIICSGDSIIAAVIEAIETDKVTIADVRRGNVEVYQRIGIAQIDIEMRR